MKRLLLTAVAALAVAGAPAAMADSIGEVEGARAYERQGSHLTRPDIEKLRRYGGNDDGFNSGYGYGYAPPYGGPGFGVYVGPGYGYGYGYGRVDPYDYD